jgi:3-phenylpropionate/trans-cinnamate dioxygenase ferredoxin subunit
MLTTRKYQWHKIADSIAELSITASGLVEVEAGGKKLCLAVKDERLFACAAKCPHAGGRMADGFMDALDCVYVRCTATGSAWKRATTVPGRAFLKTYPVQYSRKMVFMWVLRSQNLFNWLK